MVFIDTFMHQQVDELKADIQADSKEVKDVNDVKFHDVDEKQAVVTEDV
jgi:hypothetical protein